MKPQNYMPSTVLADLRAGRRVSRKRAQLAVAVCGLFAGGTAHVPPSNNSLPRLYAEDAEAIARMFYAQGARVPRPGCAGERPGGAGVTAIDARKAAADFRILDVGKRYSIAWKDGRRERVTCRQLAKLQAAHTWATDF